MEIVEYVIMHAIYKNEDKLVSAGASESCYIQEMKYTLVINTFDIVCQVMKNIPQAGQSCKRKSGRLHLTSR